MVDGRDAEFMGRMFDRGENRGWDFGSGPGSGYQDGYMEHDGNCEALIWIGAMNRRWRLLSSDETRDLTLSLKERPEMTNPLVPMSERVCACGTRSILRVDARDSRIWAVWGDNMLQQMRTVLSEERIDEIMVRFMGLLSGLQESTNDESPESG